MKATVYRNKNQSITAVCKEFNLKRDAFYKFKNRLSLKESLEQKVVDLVKKRREILPREGVRKLMIALADDFEKQGIDIGRDTLFNILRKYDMLVKPKKASARTTHSYHRFYKYNNLIKDLEITRPNQVWVSDITYIRTITGFCYLALITDLYSRKIVGYDLSDSLELTGCVRALQKALKQTSKRSVGIHHSDRGIQYCSNVYTKTLKNKGIQISMTEDNHCYENAVAERVNGILKDEFYLDQTFFSTNAAKRITKNVINLYNSKRLHVSLNYKTPENVYKSIA